MDRWDPMGPDGRCELTRRDATGSPLTPSSWLGSLKGTSSNKALAAAMAAASEVKAMESHGKPWKAMESHGKPWKVISIISIYFNHASLLSLCIQG